MKRETPLPSLHCRSHYSLLAGPLSPEDICRRAAEEGAESVGMVDRANLYGLPALYRAAGRYNLKAVAGVEFASPGSSRDSLPLFTFYPLNREGFARLNRLISRFADSSSDPVELLLKEGWEGGRVAVFRPELFPRLLERSRRGLVAALVWGLPFRAMLTEARRLRIPPLALNAALYATEEERRLYRILRAIDENRSIQRNRGTEQEGLPPAWRRRCSPAQMAAFFSSLPDALYQARLLAGDAASSLFPDSYVFPSFQGMRPEEEYQRLRGLCMRGVRRRYGSLTPAVRRRLDYELDIIRRKGFAGYFLVVQDIVARCPRTCGRGSSAASIVSYLLEITHVDPLACDLFFERFLNMGRMDPPDIDVDFPWDEREKTLDYVFAAYAGQAGMVADHVTFGSRSALRESARAFGLPEPDIGPLAEAFRMGESGLPPYLAATAKGLLGIPRHLGTHPGGVVISPGPITDYTHVGTSPLGRPLIAWEKEGTEDAGLVKIDLLGNRSLGVLRDVLTLTAPLRAGAGEPPLEWSSFNPLGDTRTREMIEAGDTLGVFYVESPATRQLLKKMRCGDYPHLVIASSIIRPAANRYINAFLRRLRGAVHDSLHPAVDEVLAETRGIMVYQEDVARVAIAVCGYSPAEADSLRKVLSKKDRSLRLPAFREEFIRRGRSRGVAPKVLEELWEGILSFEGYSFCKAHSASYALVSYRLAWLKARYPLEFFCAVINNGGGFYSRQVYLNALSRAGFPLLPPDVNRSAGSYTVERREYPGGALRTGLLQLKGVEDSFIRKLLDERHRRGPFADFQDFLMRLNPPLPDIRGLIRSGSLDGIAAGVHRPGLFWYYFHVSKHPELFIAPAAPASLGDYPGEVKLQDELETLGLLVSRHPAELLRIPEEMYDCDVILTGSGSIPEFPGKRIAIPSVLVTGKEVRTRTKKEMCFLSFEDLEGIYETVLFPEVYRRLYPRICRFCAFLVTGTVEQEFGVFQLRVEELEPLDAAPLDSPKQVCQYWPRSSLEHESWNNLRSLDGNGGSDFSGALVR
ncbi:PHP domain-containing protein [Marispirochaeta aestuarii]|uniref:helix-hairpin-helix domain-containing protein n=1 Tax=Marispirochaeta aestuarii TaxID=1963862 RepID=UPI0029C775AA|nr:PHP domain-containing protein [Marispirochaeta aestuarii]